MLLLGVVSTELFLYTEGGGETPSLPGPQAGLAPTVTRAVTPVRRAFRVPTAASYRARMNRRLYALHRWLSLAVVVQLLIWSVSGLFFAAVPKETLLGKPVPNAHDGELALGDASTSLAAIASMTEALGLGAIRRIEVRPSIGGPVGIVTGTLRRTRIDLRSGRERLVDAEEAKAIAGRDLVGAASVAGIDRIEEGRSPLEYRGKPTPAWRVVLSDGKGTAIYVDGTTGDVTARRNDTWRTYDFLWGLHIMAYRDRDDFRHALLIGAAALAALTSLSGLVLWGLRARRALRRVTGSPKV